MKQNPNRILSIFAAAAMMFSAVPQRTTLLRPALTACAANKIYDFDYEYSVSLDGSSTALVKYLGSDEKAEIPAAFEGLPVTEIKYRAFADCSTITDITIPGTVTQIGSEVFRGCSALTKVNIPSGVTAIPDSTFRDCKKLTQITVPKNVTVIDDFAFYGCTCLEQINIPDQVKKIGAFAFKECGALTALTIPDSTAEIGEYAFSGCSHLVSVTLPDSIESIDETAFEGCGNLTIKGKTGSCAESYAKAHSIPFEAAAGSSGEILGSGTCGENLTWTLDSSGVLTVSGSGRMAEWSSKSDVPWYRSRAEISKAVLEEGVTNIGGFAFYECTNLKDIAIPDGVTGIGSYAFAKCSALREITLPWSVGSVSGWAFCECAGLLSLTILNYDCNITGNPQTVCSEIIDDYTARDRAPFRGTIYSYSGSAAETFAQQHGKPFSAIEKPASGTWGSLTWEFDGTDTLNISGTGDMADFSSRPVWNARCADVKKAVIADGITSIGAYAFRDFGELTEIVIPESVRHIGREAFSGTPWLADRIAEDPLVIVNSSLYTGKTCKGKVTIPEGVTELVDEAFYKAWDITGVTFPDSLTRIGESAFYNDTELKTVVLPAAVESIGKNAFARCYPDKVTVLNGHAVIGEGAFGTDDDLILAGYDGSTAEAYAKESSLAFESLGAAPEIPTVKYGDVNDDGSIDLKDVTELRRALADWDVTVNAEAADVNKDGSLDLKDLVILRRYLAGGWGVSLS